LFSTVTQFGESDVNRSDGKRVTLMQLSSGVWAIAPPDQVKPVITQNAARIERASMICSCHDARQTLSTTHLPQLIGTYNYATDLYAL
jgi:hypothetical protein